MRLQNTMQLSLFLSFFIVASQGYAQNKAYQRKKPAAPAAVVAPAAPAGGSTTPAAAAPKKESEKLDISELEQKYWAPKDTDFSVVQNRTYTKAKKLAFTYMTGLILSDPYNEGLDHTFSVNYYFDERQGVEFIYHAPDLKDSDSVEKFRTESSGGNISPDFNRDTAFYGVGYNWVPFYAKMSFLGKKIIYFDMQFTPFIGISKYEQQSLNGNVKQDAFTFGLDITQLYFFSRHWAVRTNYHNRFYKSDTIGYQSGQTVSTGDSTTSSSFTLGITYFF